MLLRQESDIQKHDNFNTSRRINDMAIITDSDKRQNCIRSKSTVKHSLKAIAYALVRAYLREALFYLCMCYKLV